MKVGSVFPDFMSRPREYFFVMLPQSTRSTKHEKTSNFATTIKHWFSAWKNTMKKLNYKNGPKTKVCRDK